MDKLKTYALVGAETLMGREIRDLLADAPVDLRLLAADADEAGTLTEQGREAAFVAQLDLSALEDASVVFLAGSPESARKALDVGAGPALIDLTHASEDRPESRLRAPAVEPPGFQVPAGAVHLIAHPAAIALALFFARIRGAHPVRRWLAQIFEPASERGRQGLDELQQQTVSLLSFKGMPKAIFDAQLSFNMLARYGEEAPFALQDAELRIERHLASLLAMTNLAPLPSLRLVQAPVFHGHSFSLWVEFEENPGAKALEQALSADQVDVRGGDLEPPTNVGIAGQGGIAVGAIEPDRQNPQACWFWMAADNLRLAAENAVLAARAL